MDTQKIGILSLIKAAITGEAASLPADLDLEVLPDIAKTHQIVNMLYYGAAICGLDETSRPMQALFGALCKCLIISEKQTKEIDAVLGAFSENGIDHMPLKGTVLRNLYPRADMRLMSDADILIKTEQYSRISSVMTALGFAETVESDHDHVWKKPGVVMELHKRLIPSYNKDYFSYYGDGWKLAALSGDAPHRYTMLPEDQMIYLFTHFAKHYRSGGIGLRHVTDLYVYRKSIGKLDEAYIKTELIKLRLYPFYENILEMLKVWFEDGKPTEKTELITDVIFESGAYGQRFRRGVAETILLKRSSSFVKSEKCQHILRMLFPSIRNMQLQYTLLGKAPVLLPVMWIVRIFKVVFFKRKRVKFFYDNMKNISTGDVADYKKELQYVGLDFNFEEKHA